MFCWVRSYLASNSGFITFAALLVKVSWHGIQRETFAAALLLGLPDSYSSSGLSSTLFRPFPVLRTSLISLPDGASKKLHLLLTLISLKCTLKKKKHLLESEIYLKLQRLSQFLFLSTEVLFETERHMKSATE